MNQYPIRTLSELTGIPTTTLRAWERRYGLLKPVRTPAGHRLYSSDDVELVRNISALLKNNHTISEAIRLIRAPTGQDTEPAFSGAAHWLDFQQRILKAIDAFNEANLDQVYTEALSLYPIDRVTEQVIVPVLKTLGERWPDRPAGIAEEHFFSVFLRNKLGARFHHQSQRSRGRQILVACLPGEYHELGLLLFCMAAMGRGYRILYLGTDMPVAQIPAVVSRTGVAAVLLSGSNREQWDRDQAAALRACIATLAIPVMFGGHRSDAFTARLEQLGGHCLGSNHGRALDRMEHIVPAFSVP